MHATNKDKAIARDADRIKPNERWQSQQKTAWAKLVRSETPGKQIEDLGEQMITEDSPVRKAKRHLSAKLERTAADRISAEAVDAELEDRDVDFARE